MFIVSSLGCLLTTKHMECKGQVTQHRVCHVYCTPHSYMVHSE